MARLSLHGKLYLFADDAILFYPGPDDSANCILMNQDLNTLDVYFSHNCLGLNLSKTKCIHFRDPHKRLTRQTAVSLRNECIEEVEILRYLGVDIDCNLTWRAHIDQLCRRLSQLVGVLYKIRHLVPLHVLKKAYFGLIHPQIVYILLGWGNATKTTLRRVQILQNRSLKNIFGLERLTPTIDLYAEHAVDILPVKGLQIYSACRYVYLCLYGMIHHTIDFRLQDNIESNRDYFKIFRPRSNTDWGMRRISCLGPTIFNSLPLGLRAIPSASLFLKKLKEYLHRSENLEKILTFQLPC